MENIYMTENQNRKVTVAACSLSQWALDFEGNLDRIIKSIRIAKEKGARYRLGPELEIPGYGCNDHFYENDTLLHSWESLACILEDDVCDNDVIIDVGMPIRFSNAVYNCRVVILNKKILLIRPKQTMALDGNYRETRWFTPWTKIGELEELQLPAMISKITGQSKVPFGDAVIATRDTVIGSEICEELLSPNSPHLHLALQGVEIFTNGSASHFEIGKTEKQIKLISHATSKLGGLYIYSCLKGCDGERQYYDRPSMVFKNGELTAQGRQFSLDEVEVVTSTVDLEEVSTKRRMPAFGNKTGLGKVYPRIEVDFAICRENGLRTPVNDTIEPHIFTLEQQIELAPACWLWDYLRRSKMCGFFLPLSGGIDSSSTACIVASMCRLVCASVQEGNTDTLKSVREMVNEPDYTPIDAKELCYRLLVTCYMGTENSSVHTKERASGLAKDIGSYHLGIVIDKTIQAMMALFTAVTGTTPKFHAFGGTMTEDLALQNIQARARMVLAYLFAQLTLWSRGKPGSLLVLATSNVEESLIGHLTKYDCSSADLNPIGGISKIDLKKFVFYLVNKYNYTSLIGIVEAPPTPELIPLKDGQVNQIDEDDLGLTYEELSLFGHLRKENHCGPYTMFTTLLSRWIDPPAVIAEKVKVFFQKYALNRNKMTVITPAFHAGAYSPDDNRYDLRPFLYRSNWPWQFRSIDRVVKAANQNGDSLAAVVANQRLVSKSLCNGEGVLWNSSAENKRII